MKLVTIFETINISVAIFLMRDSHSKRLQKMLIAEEFSSDEEPQRHFGEMTKARNLALKFVLESPPTIDRNDRDTPH